MARKAKTKSISFTEEYFSEYEYLNNMKGASSYVCELVRKDFNKKNSEEEISKQIEELKLRLENLLKNGNNDNREA